MSMIRCSFPFLWGGIKITKRCLILRLLIFNEVMMRSTLYYTNRLSWIFIVLVHWNNSLQVENVAPLGHIILIPSQPVFALSLCHLLCRSRFSSAYVAVLFMLNALRLDAVVIFVDMCGIVGHYYLKICKIKFMSQLKLKCKLISWTFQVNLSVN
jgi:hypothetical protein